jgi:hypothetical protein
MNNVKDVEGNGCGPTDVLSRHFNGRGEENSEKFSRDNISLPRFELRTYQIRI